MDVNKAIKRIGILVVKFKECSAFFRPYRKKVEDLFVLTIHLSHIVPLVYLSISSVKHFQKTGMN